MEATLENLARWIDELAGDIEILRKKVNNAGGGDTVTITPALESGTKVADYSIGETTGSLYAPTVIPLDIGTTEKKIGTYDGEDLYAILKKDVALTNGTNNQLGLTGVVVRHWYGKIKSSLVAYEYPLTFYSDATTASISTTTDNGGDIRIRPTMASATFGTITADVVVLYTKTSPVESKKTKKKER